MKMTSTVFFQILCLILLQLVSANQAISQTFTMSADYNYQSVTNNGGKNVYDDPCPSKGIVIESLQIVIATKCSESGHKNIFNSTGVNEKEKLLVKYIKKECTGRPQCELQETWNIRPTLKCHGSQIPIDKINIKGRCLQTNIDNKTVFDFQQIQKLHLLHNVFIISQSQKINRICRLSGHGGIIKITFLLVDFDTTESENTTQLFSINDAFLCLNPKKMSNLIQHAYTSVKNATIEVWMNNGFLWMEIEAQNPTLLVCEEHYSWTSSCFKPTDYEVLIKNRPTEISSSPKFTSSWGFIVIIGFLIVFFIVLMSFAIYKKIAYTTRTISSVASTQTETHVYNLTTPNTDNHVYTGAIVNQRDTSVYTNASGNQRENHTYNLKADDRRDSHIYNPMIILPPQNHTYSAALQTDGSESGYIEVSDLEVEPHYVLVK